MKKKRSKNSKRGGKAAAQTSLRRGFGYDWTLLGLHLLLLVPPFVFLRGIADSFRLPKLVLSGSLALLAVAFLCLRLRRSQGTEGAPTHGIRSLSWTSPAVLLITPLLVVSVVGLWTSEHAGLVARTLPWLAAGCAFLLAATHLLRESDRRRALHLMVWPAAILAAIGLLQALGLWQPMEFQRQVGTRLATTSLAGGAFDLSAYIVLPLLLAQERIWSRRGRPWLDGGRLAWLLAIGLLGGALLATQTLGSILAALIGSLAFWLYLAWRGDLPRKRLGIVFGAGLALVVVAVLAVTPVRERVAQKMRQIERGDVNVFLTGRVDGWRAALWMAEEHPVTGVGTGAFRAEFGDARLALQDQGVEFFAGHRQPYFINAHNEVLEAMAEWGWPGLAVVLWIVWIVGRRVRWSSDEPGGDDARGTSWDGFVTAALVAVVVVSLTNFPWRLGLIAFPWLLVVASVLSRRPESTDDPQADAEHADTEHRETRWSAKTVAAVLAVVSLAAALWLFDAGKDRVGCQRLVQSTESLALEGARRGGLPNKARELGLDLLRRAEVLDPAEVSVFITRGGLFMVGGRMESAERSYRQALEMENRSEVWINLARLHLAAGDRELALDAARMAQRLDSRVARKMPEFPELAMSEDRKRRSRRKKNTL